MGGGPTSMGAAVYGASEGLDTLAIKSTVLVGQAGTSRRIENYLGDVRSGSTKRCATAVGEGATVVRFVHERLAAAAASRR